MKWVLAIVLPVFMCVGGCSTMAAREASKAEILAAVKRLAAPGCQPRDSALVRTDGCDYDAFFADGQWQAVAVPYQVVAGKRMHAASGPMYIFSSTGKLIHVVPGM